MLTGHVAAQPLWEFLHRVSLLGMNVGMGSSVGDSGEMFAIRYARQVLEAAGPLTVFDVGSNTGDYAQAVVKELRTSVRLYCFEPSKVTFHRLSERLAGTTGVLLFNIGLSDTEGPLLLYCNEQCSGLASVYNRRLEHFGISMPLREEITTCTLDSFCAEHAVSRIHFLKLDVEGHELKALEGARQLIENEAIDFVQFEFGGCNIDSRTFFQDFYYLLKPKFTLHRILRRGLLRIDRYRETLEQFVTTNYLAISRHVNS